MHSGGEVPQQVQVFSTRGVPAPRKAAAWNQMLGELTSAIEIQPSDPLHFDGTLIRRRVGPLTLFGIHCAGVRLRNGTSVRRSAARRSYQLLMPLQAGFTLAYGRRPAVEVGPGSFCLIDQCENYEVIHGDGLRTVGLELPHALMEARLAEPARHAGRVLRPEAGAERLLAGLLRTLDSELTAMSGSTEPLPSLIAHSIMGFVAAAFADAATTDMQQRAATRLCDFREYADTRLCDEAFRPADVARHFNVSERYVRMVFQAAGEPLSAYLLRRRLERAAGLLRHGQEAHRTITAIALECGFNSATHFGQRFRERYGMTPRAWRYRR